MNEAGHTELRRTLRRGDVVGFFAAQPACTVICCANTEVVLEACGAAHHWGRVLTGLGHTVRPIAPEAVRPFVKRGEENDAADAAAPCETARRPEVKFVPVKGLEQQGVLAWHTARALLVKQQMLANALRSLAAVPGLDPGIGVVAQGFAKLAEPVTLATTQADLPEPARQALQALGEGLPGTRRVATTEPAHAQADAGLAAQRG